MTTIRTMEGADLHLRHISEVRHFEISDSDFELLRIACIHHTDGKTAANVTVQTCWDADRLDLGRVGIKPHPKYLCTEAAKNPEMISWAYERSIQNFTPEFVKVDWE